MKSLSSIIRLRGDAYRVYVPLMGLVAYRGYTLVCVSMLPIRGRESLIYGSMDGGKSVAFDGEDASVIDEVATRLNLKPHACGRSGDVKLSFPTDIEGHRGSGDNRVYVIDAARVFPAEPPNQRGAFLYRLMREEAVRSSVQPLCSDSFSAFQKCDVDADNNNLAVAELFRQLLDERIPELARTLERLYDPANPNFGAELGLLDDQIAAGEAATNISRLTSLTCDPRLLDRALREARVAGGEEGPGKAEVESFLHTTPVDTASRFTRGLIDVLIQELHKRGLNMRHLGALWWALDPTSLWCRVVLTVMVLRVTKNTCRAMLRRAMHQLKIATDAPYVQTVVGFFNLVLGQSANSSNYWRNELARSVCRTFFYRKEIPPPVFPRCGTMPLPAAFECVGSDGKFDVNLVIERFALRDALRSLVDMPALLIMLPQVLGVQLDPLIMSRTISVFTLETIFEAQDVVRMSPTEKHFSMIDVSDALAEYQHSLAFAFYGSKRTQSHLAFSSADDRAKAETLANENEVHWADSATDRLRRIASRHCERALALLDKQWTAEVNSENAFIAVRCWIKAASAAPPQITVKHLPNLVRFVRAVEARIVTQVRSQANLQDETDFIRDLIFASQIIDSRTYHALKATETDLTQAHQRLLFRIRQDTQRLMFPLAAVWISAIDAQIDHDRLDFLSRAMRWKRFPLSEASKSKLPQRLAEVPQFATALKTLDLRWSHTIMSDKLFCELAQLTPAVEEILMSADRVSLHWNVESAIVEAFSHWHRLRKLTTNLNDVVQSFDFLAQAPNLQSLRITCINGISGKDLRRLPEICPNIRRLFLRRFKSGVTKDDLFAMCQLPSLRYLDLDDAIPASARDVGSWVNYFVELDIAKNLRLMHIRPTNRNICTAELLCPVFPALRHIALEVCTSETLAAIATSKCAPVLRTVILRSRADKSISEDDLIGFFSACKSLQHWQTSQFDQSVSCAPSVLSALPPSLKSLALELNRSVDVAAVLEIVGMTTGKSLVALRLTCHPESGSDVVLKAIGRNFSRLQFLHFEKVGSITPHGFEALCRGTPLMQEVFLDGVKCSVGQSLSCTAPFAFWPALKVVSLEISSGSSLADLTNIFRACRKLDRLFICFDMAGTFNQMVEALSEPVMPASLVSLGVTVRRSSDAPISWDGALQALQQGSKPLLVRFNPLNYAYQLVRGLGPAWGSETEVTFTTSLHDNADLCLQHMSRWYAAVTASIAATSAAAEPEPEPEPSVKVPSSMTVKYSPC